MKKLEIDKKYLAWIIGMGLIFWAIHNPLQPLKEFAFLPVIGFALSLLAITLLLLTRDWTDKDIPIGSKWIYIPLLVIVASLVGQIFTQPFREGLPMALFGGYLFLMYIAGLILDKELLKPFIFATVIIALSCIVYGILEPGVKTGGIVSPTNYDIATGVLVIGALVSIFRGQWVVVSIALVGLFFTGAEEAIFACFVVGVIVLARKDWSKRIWLPVGVLIATLAICTLLGVTQKLYLPTAKKTAAVKEVVEQSPVAPVVVAVIPEQIRRPIVDKLDDVKGNPKEASIGEWLDKATGNRWQGHWELSPIKPLGYGLNITNFYDGIPHNIILIIIEQVGIAAAIAWLFITIYCLVKTKWKYLFAGVLALGVFDHYLWTQIAPWWWCLVGVATVSSLQKDYIFRRTDK